MNFSVENFGAGMQPLDLALYAGVLMIVYVFFKDKIHQVFNSLKEKFKTTKVPSSILTDYFADDPVDELSSDPFFALVQSWKQMRDLAEENGLDKAVELANEMFPYLVPNKEVEDHDYE